MDNNQKIVAVGIAAAVGVVTLGAIYYLYSSSNTEERDLAGETQEPTQISEPVDQDEEPAFKQASNKRKHEDSEDTTEEEDQKRRKTAAAEAQKRAEEQQREAERKRETLKQQARELRQREEAEAAAKRQAEKAKRDAEIAKQKAEEEKERAEAQARAEEQKKIAEAKAAAEAAEAERLRILNAVKPVQPEVRATKAHQLASHKLFKVTPSASLVQEAPTTGKRQLSVSLSHCKLAGDGLDLSKIKLGTRAIFKLQVCDQEGKPVDLPAQNVGFEVEGAEGIKKGINKLDVGLFEMFWRPRTAAKYTVTVKIGSHNVGKSPYTFDIKE